MTEARTQPPNEWPELERRRLAIVVADLVESVRMMEVDEVDIIERWRRFVHQVQAELLPRFGAALVKSLGDGMLLQGPDAAAAVAMAQEMHRRMAGLNSGRAGEQQMQLRIGVHLSDVMVDQLDVYGAGVNLAARLAGLAEPGETVVSADVRDRLADDVDARIEDMGMCYLKHIVRPERAFRLKAVDAASAAERIPSFDALAPTVAVVPLRALDVDPRSALSGELVSDSVIARLSRNPSLRVISRLSTRVVRDHPKLDDAVRQHLNATYVMTGHCVVEGARLSMHVELADMRNQTVLWADRLACPLAELTSAEGQVLDELAQAVHLAILNAELARVRTMPFPSLESFSLLLGSMSLLHRASTEDFERAHDGLQALIERAPRHSSGYALKAQWYALRMNRGLSSSIAEDLRRAHQDSERAVAVDPENATAHTCRGLILGFFERDLEAADRCYARALALNPNEPMAWLFTATLRSWQGRGRESAAAAEQALRLSPLDPQRYYYDSLAAVAMLADDQYARAIELARRSLRVNRLHTSTYRVLAIAQMLAGDAEAARATVRSLRELEPQLTVAGYLARYPGAGRPHADRYAGALAEAGLPP